MLAITFEVTESALLKRVQRRLAHDMQRLVKVRNRPRGYSHSYMLLDSTSNAVVSEYVNLEKIARELGCLEEIEEIAD